MLINLQQRQTLFRFLAVLLVLHTCFIAYAQGMQGGDEKVTINGKNIPLRDVFKSITRQTGLHFFYSPEVVNVQEKVTVDAKQQPVDNVLNNLLGDKGLAWVYNDNAIAIRSKDQGEKKRVRSDSRDSLNHPVTVNITGKVTDAEGNAIPGATVLVKGTEKGTNTDVDGTFTLPGVTLNTVVLISSVGFETREIPVKGKSINAKLNVVVNDLDETVVIAYGTTTKRMNTGNVSTVKAEDIQRQPISNPLLALQGRVPGIFIEQATGLPGSGVKVRIQGQNSIRNGNDPLYVIDGIPYTSQLLPSLNSVLGNSGTLDYSGNPLSFINPADIESIDVLKDADATAIYGSRAANGAILITTKKGKAGQTKVDINMQSGWGKVTRKLKLLNTPQYLEMRNEAFLNDGGIPSADPNDPDYAADLKVWDTTRYTDWQKELIGGTAQYRDLQVTISGGNASSQYLVGAGYHKETTVFPGDLTNQKGSLHFNVNNVSPNQKFRLQLSGNYLVDNNQIINTDLTQTAIRLAPNAPSLYNADGSLNWAPNSLGTSTWINPLSYLNNKYKNKTYNLIGNALISYQILPGLEIKSSFGYTNMQTNEVSIGSLLSVPPESRPFNERSSQFGNGTIRSWIIEPQATYKQSIGKGRLEALLGTTILQNNSDRQHIAGGGYNSDLVVEDIRAAASVSIISTINSVYKYNAVFGRINYNWQDRYILNITARRDGSSRFGRENLFHNFGSVAGAWIFSNERFLKQNLPFVSFGKLRASYGTTGSDQIGDYQFMNLYTAPDGVAVPYQGATGLQPNGLQNPYLQWEETRKLQFGLDLGLFKDRVLFYMNYFHNRSSNQLLPYALPIITGFADITTNFPATVQNTGWELSLNSTNLRSTNFSWTSNINFTLPKNKLVAFPNLATSSYGNIYIVGKPITLTKAFHFSGVDQTTGMYQFSNSHGNITSSPDFSTDRTILINTSPKFYGGIQNNFRYKGFELDILFQFVKQMGRNYFFGNRPGAYFGTSNIGNEPTSVLRRWQKPGDLTSIQRYNSNSSLAFLQLMASNFSDAAWSDASYIRLKNFSISWQLPDEWRRKVRLQNCRLYIQGQNLLTITNYIGMDPENRGTTSLPPLRVMTVGVQLTL